MAQLRHKNDVGVFAFFITFALSIFIP